MKLKKILTTFPSIGKDDSPVLQARLSVQVAVVVISVPIVTANRSHYGFTSRWTNACCYAITIDITFLVGSALKTLTWVCT